MSHKNKIDKLRSNLANVLRRLPEELAEIALDYTRDAFKKEAWDGKPWPERKNDGQRSRLFKSGSSREKVRSKSRGLLVQSGDLRRSVRILKVGIDSFTIGTDRRYAKAHNEGDTISHPGGTPYKILTDKKGDTRLAWMRKVNAANASGFTKPHPIKIPQRQFIGKSEELLREMRQHYINRISAVFR
ncbi:phage virion morphogenesis protein [Limibacter armeniacum]|uniref:phage virion morphogenesis protein n=1 Tax=Limibacter armeniacum TaxID=466084 RepID=UPI002FE65B65